MLLRELVAKLRSMTETIKMLSTENVALREENDGLVMMRATNSGLILLYNDKSEHNVYGFNFARVCNSMTIYPLSVIFYLLILNIKHIYFKF